MAKWMKNTSPETPLHKLSQIRSANDQGGVSFQGFLLDDYVTLLAHCIDYDPGVPQRRRRALCRSALFSHDPIRPLTPASFMAEVNRVERRQINLKRRTFWLRTSISLQGLQRRHHGVLGNTHYCIDSRPTVPDPRFTSLLQRVERSLCVKELPRNYLPLWLRCSGYDGFDAGLQALDCLDSLRGLWNYSANRHRVRRSFGKRSPVNQIVLGPVHALLDENKALVDNEWLYDSSYVAPVPPFDVATRWAQIKENERTARRALHRRWYADLVMTAFRRYARALDDTRYESSFLSLWGILETLTLTQYEHYDETIARASSVFVDPEYIRCLLVALRSERNDLVHANAEFEDPEVYLYQLKSVVDGLLFYWLGAARSMKSEDEVRMFLRLPPRAITLRRRKAILDAAISYRRG